MNKYLNELGSEIGLLSRYRYRRLKLDYIESLSGNSKPTFEELRRTYDILQKQLNLHYRDSTIRTIAEVMVANLIRRATKLVFHKSMWIMNRNVDLFCPAIGRLHPPVVLGQAINRTPVMRGLVVEVDGSIHDRELKMKKDTHKYALLHELHISVTVIQNCDIDSPVVRSLIQQLKFLSRLGSRERQRQLRRIYIATIAYHADDIVLEQLWPDINGCLERGTHEKQT